MDTIAIKNQLNLAQGQRMVQECQASGKTAAAWCEENGIARWRYFYWLKKVREAACEKMMIGKSQLPETQHKTLVFAELSQPVCRKKDVALTLKLDDFDIEIYNGADGDVIAQTIQALKNIC
jgi:hypothetical protein